MKHSNLPDNWASLPTEEILMGGVKKKIKYDKSNNTVYMLNDRGEWTGEKAHPPARKQEEPIQQTKQDPEEQSGESPAEMYGSKKQKKKKSKMNIFLVIVIVVLLGALIIQNISLGGPKSYSVIIAMQNIQPGESVAGKLSELTISAADYQRYTASGGLYLAEDYDAIKNYKATTFIPQDGFITYANIGKEFVTTNPWTAGGDKTTIQIPVSVSTDNLKEMMWGNKVTITITATRETSSKDNPDATPSTSDEVQGSTTITTYQTDTYTMKNFTIVDVLNTKGKSLYSTYAAMAAIPDLYRAESIESRYKTEEQMIADTPAYIKIVVSSETKRWWDEINSPTKKYKIKVSLTVTGFDGDEGGGEFAYKAEVNKTMQDMAKTIAAAWALLKED